jgi:Asp-tRNA(Asn)/Glu-tRNA(Gln) amidotransferase C subunit
MKTDEKQEALAQLDLLEEELQNLNDSFESIRNMTENVYK